MKFSGLTDREVEHSRQQYGQMQYRIHNQRHFGKRLKRLLATR